MTIYYPPTQNAIQKTLDAQLLEGITASMTLNNVVGIANKPGVCVVDFVDTNNKETPTKREYIAFTGVSGNTLTGLTRNADGGGTDQDHSVGAIVQFPSDILQQKAIIDTFTVEHGQDGKHTSAVVTTLKATGAEINTGTEDAKIVTPKAIADSYLANGYSSIHRQAIINGNFDVWQRGTSFTDFSTTKYTADRWTSYCANTATTISRQDGTGVSGSQYCIRLQRTVGNTGTDMWTLNHGLETTDSIKFRGKKLTLSFYARAGANYSASTISSTIYSGKGTDQSPWSFTTDTSIGGCDNTITTTWTKFSVTTTNVVASDVTQLRIAFARSSSGTAGAADYCEIAQVQLCAGDVALPFMPKSFEEELRDCRRYCKILRGEFNVGFYQDANTILFPITFEPEMRSGDYSKTILGTAGTDIRVMYNASAISGFAFSIENMSSSAFRIVATKTSHGLTNYFVTTLHIENGGGILLESEL